MDNDRHMGLDVSLVHRAAALLCMALALLSPMALLGSGNDARKVVRVPCRDFNKLMIVDEHGHPVSGYAYDYIQTIATYARWDIEYVPCGNFSECVEKLLAGEADIFYDISYTEERAEVILYPDEPMGHEYYYLYTSENNTTITPGDHESLNGKTVGVTSGTMQIDLLKEWCKKRDVDLKLVEYKSIPDKEADLLAGKIDLDLEVSMLATHDLSAVERVGSSAYFLVANKERPDLIDDINSALDNLLKNDLYYLVRLEERYFSDTVLSHNLTVDEKEWIENHKVLRVGFIDKYLPFSTMGNDGRPIGAAIEAITEIIRLLKLDGKLEIEFICYGNQEEGYKAVESGEADLMFPAYVSNSVMQDYHIIGGRSLATLASDIAYLDKHWDGKGMRIGVNRNNLMQCYYSRDTYPDSEIVFYDDIGGCLDGLLDGTSDVTFLNGHRSKALLKPGKYHSLRTVRAKSDFTFCMAFAEDNIGLMLLMDRGLAMLDPDFVNKASYSYVGQMYSFSMMDFLREHIVSVVLTVALLAALIVALVIYGASNRKLAAMNRELKEYSETIERQRRQESELRGHLEDALQMARSANKAKTTFLSNMSHDIRTPMNAIIGFTELATKHIGDQERVRDCLSTIAQSSGHLLSLINDVLDMSRIESGKMTLNEKAESLADIVNALRDIVHADVQAKRHEFTIDMGGVRDELVFCDKLRLNQVLLNLVSNAIKYTPPGGRISLRVVQRPSAKAGHGDFEFRVRDNGIGMGEEFAKTIFDSFTREENSTVSGIQGTGLGMAIAKNIVEMMGGSISVATKKGEGTEFTVSVNFRIAAGKAPEQAPKEESPLSLKGKRILMADDSELNLKIGVLLLQEQGMVVDTASNGQMAVDKIREKGVGAYDFILMDVQMPVMDGYEATAALRKLPDGDKLKIIAFSANAFEEDKEKSLKAGMDGHITKPLKIGELFNELGRFVG